eukprot:134758-Rhodomonas_salina.2
MSKVRFWGCSAATASNSRGHTALRDGPVAANRETVVVVDNVVMQECPDACLRGRGCSVNASGP